MTVRNLQTVVDYATWTLAIAALPNPLDQDYTLEDQNSATYAESVAVGIANAGFTLTLRGRVGFTKPIINAGGFADGIDVTLGKVVLRDLDVRAATNIKLRIRGGGTHTIDRVVAGLTGGSGWALVVDNTQNVTVQNSLLRQVSGNAEGVRLLGNTDGLLFDHTTIDSLPSTLASNAYSVIRFAQSAGARTTTFRNCILRGHDDGAGFLIYRFSSVANRDGLTSNYNYFAPGSNMSVAGVDAGASYITLVDWQATGKDANSQYQQGDDPLAEPIFINVTTDFHLAAGTRALDAADPGSAVAVDLDNVSRPQPVGGIRDIGAYETLSTVITNAGAIVSTEAHGTPTVKADWIVTNAGAIASSEAFGTPLVVLAIHAVGIASVEAFGLPKIENFGVLITAPTTGLITGGTEVIVAGSGIDMSALSDDFEDGVLDAGKWTAVIVGGGVVSEIGDALELITVAGADRAGVRAVTAAAAVDARADYAARSITFGAATEAVTAGLGLYVGAADDLWLEVLETRRGTKRARVTARVGGVTTWTRETALGSGSFSGQLRVLRVGGAVACEVSGTEVAALGWLSTNAQPELRAGGAVLRSGVTSFARVPVVTFAGEVASLSEVVSPARVHLWTPAGRVSGAAQTLVYGEALTAVAIPDGFIYTLDSRVPVVGRAGTRTLTAKIR